MKRAKILFVDDQKTSRDLMLRLLDPEKYEGIVAASVVEAQERMREDLPDLVITDLRMPDLDGLEGLKRFRAIDAAVPVVLITAFGTVETAVEAMKHGAFDYLRKPFDPSEIEIAIERALAHRALVRENAQLRSEVARRAPDSAIVSRSAAMKAAMDLVTRVAPTDFAVLILGESGTGKDLFARRIHELSHRAQAPFVSLNCSAIPEHLLESELFGHEKGAFSGATTARAGFFAEADGGTLFLDEIADMSPNLQPKLLRVLQNGEFYAVGSRRLVRTDVRLVCASNRNVEELVEKGEFRQDLYYRIHTVSLVLPPLRERTEDIKVLADHFLARMEGRCDHAPRRVASGAMRYLLEYDWPGNVRELAHVIEWASLVADSDEIQEKDLPPRVRGVRPRPAAGDPAVRRYKEARDEFEHSYFTQILARAEGRIQEAAALAGLHRSTLYEKLTKLGIPIESSANHRHAEPEAPPSGGPEEG